jgi:hypothetical protein
MFQEAMAFAKQWGLDDHVTENRYGRLTLTAAI